LFFLFKEVENHLIDDVSIIVYQNVTVGSEIFI